MTLRLARLTVFLGCLGLTTSLAFAQGAASTTSLSGVVKDTQGGVIPGATITVKNEATGVSQTTVTNEQGLYSFPTMDVGAYTVTVEMPSFKKMIHTDVRLLGNQPANLTTTLQIGGLTEEVTVSTPTDVVRLESPTVTSTISAEFIKSVPRLSRNALDFLVFLPGVETQGTNARGSTISGLPQNTINITIDGVSTSNNLQSGDGFFTMVTPRLDAIEEVTLTTATAGADSSAQGATQVRFVTKSGTNTYRGTAYEYFQHAMFNSNTYFNRLNHLPVPRATVDTYGGSFGGPIVLPKIVNGRGKAFFFFNEEVTWTPTETPRGRTILRPSALAGTFTYNINNPTPVNVLELAARNGQIATMDPTIRTLLSAIDAATKTTGSISDTSTNLNTTTFNYLVSVATTRNSPTTRLDINLTPHHRLTGTYYLQRYKDSPDTLNNAEPTFPGFPAWAHQNSYRTTGSTTLRSTLGPSLVNEVIFGWQSSPNDFFTNSSPDMFTNQNGYAVTLGFPVSPNNSNITNVAPNNANNPAPRNTPNFNLDNNVNWLTGRHSFKFGTSFTRISNWATNWNSVPTLTLGFNTTNDPAAAMFSAANFPGATSNDLNNARSLYALLTGRVSSIGGTGRLTDDGKEYVYLGKLTQAERMDEYGLYASDNWRMKPNLTMSLGVRYELQLPMVPTKSTRTTATLTDLCGPSGLGDGVGGRPCNLYHPGVFNNPGQVPTYKPYSANTAGYTTDKNNLAPILGLSYRPGARAGFLRRLFGDPDQAVLSAGFTRSFNRERIDRFTGVYGGNPGATTPATRNTAATGYPLVPAGESWPLLFSQPSRLGPPNFPKTPTFPITAATNNDVRIFAPKIQMPYTDSWTIGFQRPLSKNTAVEVRYIGNRNWKPWGNDDYNTVNWIENGLLDEFKVAQTNLLANVKAGRGGTFAYFGEGTGTRPLPIFLSHFTGLPASAAGNPANYTVAAFPNAAQFTSTDWIDDLDPLFPNPTGSGIAGDTGIAGNLYSGNSGVWRTNGRNGGLPTNFWVMNPLVDEATVMTNQGGSRYQSVQFDVRRRYASGFQIQGSYTYARSYSLTNLDLHFERRWRRATTIPHKIAVLWVWDVPVGRGRRFGADMNPWLDNALGGWQFSGGGRMQIPYFRLGNTKVVGMTHDEAQALFKKIRIDVDPLTGATTVWDMPADVVQNTQRAYNNDVTQPSGYQAGQEPTGRYFAPASSLDCMGLFFNDCAPDMYFYGRWFGEFDFKFVKKVKLAPRVSFDVNVEVFNALTAKNFTQTITPSNSANVFRVTSTASGARRGQLVFRLNF